TIISQNVKRIQVSIVFLFLALVSYSCSETNTDSKEEPAIVDHFGQLRVEGKHIINESDSIMVLRGMSFFWSQWGADYYNKETIEWLRDDWKCTVIRAAVGVEYGGYLENKFTELTKAYAVIDACIELGIYVIVDWHDHHAEDHLDDALEFFRTISHKYGDKPNIIYEIYNEPLDVSWQNILAPFADTVIAEIRKNDPDNIIIVGTPNWSQDVDDVIGHRIEDDNIVYTLHFYASTHGQWLRDKAALALSANIPIFVSEWGYSEASGTGNINLEESDAWQSFMDSNHLSWCNWSVINKDESSAALKPSTLTPSGWSEEELTQSGKMVRNYLIEMNSALFDQIK
ncbi:MAG TPA: glycoside hydrolase family 5 protein, partial [Caldithrix sp.]|nr:glycoside hydrolase family 5 protein [Caldithrix sp.]